ncbi:hypothetical protein AURDEDRAFT_162365 [Auricularia subglabra TFB-10046 SS5]|nr:hypothetical protein AURDEDRAFT_162365 [Auricularia subglabra TFB-10046 SS5]
MPKSKESNRPPSSSGSQKGSPPLTQPPGPASTAPPLTQPLGPADTALPPSPLQEPPPPPGPTTSSAPLQGPPGPTNDASATANAPGPNERQDSTTPADIFPPEVPLVDDSWIDPMGPGDIVDKVELIEAAAKVAQAALDRQFGESDVTIEELYRRCNVAYEAVMSAVKQTGMHLEMNNVSTVAEMQMQLARALNSFNKTIKDVNTSLAVLGAPLVREGPERLARAGEIGEVLKELGNAISVDFENLNKLVKELVGNESDRVLAGMEDVEEEKRKSAEQKREQDALAHARRIDEALANISTHVVHILEISQGRRESPPHFELKDKERKPRDDESLETEDLYDQEPKKSDSPPPPEPPGPMGPPGPPGPPDEPDGDAEEERKPEIPDAPKDGAAQPADQHRSTSVGADAALGPTYLPKVKDLPAFHARPREDVDDWINQISTIYEQMGVDENKVTTKSTTTTTYQLEGLGCGT